MIAGTGINAFRDRIASHLLAGTGITGSRDRGAGSQSTITWSTAFRNGMASGRFAVTLLLTIEQRDESLRRDKRLGDKSKRKEFPYRPCLQRFFIRALT